MQAYEVGFFNELLNDAGRQYHCCQRLIRIRASKSKERAILAAEFRFARAEKVPHWHLRAASFEIRETEK